MSDRTADARSASRGGLYHTGPEISSGAIKLLLERSPFHFKHGGRSSGVTPAMRIGTAIHRGVLQPDYYERCHPVYTGAARRGKAWQTFVAEHPEAHPDEILIASEYERVRGAIESVKRHRRAMELLRSGVSECELFWAAIPETGRRGRAKPDCLGPETLIDLKSTGSHNFSRGRLATHAVNAGWHIQLAWYASGARENGFPVKRVYLIVAESDPPHDVAVWRVSDALLSEGFARCRKALEIIAECERAGVWPGVGGEDELLLELPAAEIPWPPQTDSAGDAARGGSETNQRSKENNE